MFETAVRQDVQKYIQNHDRSSVTYRNQYIEEFEFAETPLTRFSNLFAAKNSFWEWKDFRLSPTAELLNVFCMATRDYH
ncbi:MAG TPA: hypothetical protein VHV29_02595 [Terriglobales bacterium]|jgi:hypothetical protein|nr:hypothetical protein [Terriglobales bacterium]